MKVRKHKSILVLLLMAGLLASFGRHGTFVLCFGEDGHVAVEAASAEHCCEPVSAVPLPPSSGVPAKPGIHESDYPCGSCLDIPLPISTGVVYLPPPESRIPHNHQTVQSCTSFSTACVQQVDAKDSLQHIPSTYYHPTDLLSTTILLI